jgi:hypothetical protein
MDPNTNNIALDVPVRGSNTGTWDVPLNSNSTAIDGFLGGVQTIGASNANIVLTAPAGSITPTGGPTQAQNFALKFTGALTGNVQVTLPLPGGITIHNLTTGNFVLTFAAATSGQIIGVDQGSVRRIYNDGANVYLVDLPEIGTYHDFCDATVPAWITACTVPPFLNCDGSTFNATTYPYLNAKLGGNTLPDLRGGSRATLNQGTGRITTAGSGIDGNTRFSRGGSELTQSHTHVAAGTTGSENATHTHTGGAGTNVKAGVAAGGSFLACQDVPIQNTGTESANHQHTFSVTTTSFGAGTGQNMPPTTIAGITLIRAA